MGNVTIPIISAKLLANIGRGTGIALGSKKVPVPGNAEMPHKAQHNTQYEPASEQYSRQANKQQVGQQSSQRQEAKSQSQAISQGNVSAEKSTHTRPNEQTTYASTYNDKNHIIDRTAANTMPTASVSSLLSNSKQPPLGADHSSFIYQKSSSLTPVATDQFIVRLLQTRYLAGPTELPYQLTVTDGRRQLSILSQHHLPVNSLLMLESRIFSDQRIQLNIMALRLPSAAVMTSNNYPLITQQAFPKEPLNDQSIMGSLSPLKRSYKTVIGSTDHTADHRDLSFGQLPGLKRDDYTIKPRPSCEQKSNKIINSILVESINKIVTTAKNEDKLDLSKNQISEVTDNDIRNLINEIPKIVNNTNRTLLTESFREIAFNQQNYINWPALLHDALKNLINTKLTPKISKNNPFPSINKTHQLQNHLTLQNTINHEQLKLGSIKPHVMKQESTSESLKTIFTRLWSNQLQSEDPKSSHLLASRILDKQVKYQLEQNQKIQVYNTLIGRHEVASRSYLVDHDGNVQNSQKLFSDNEFPSITSNVDIKNLFNKDRPIETDKQQQLSKNMLLNSPSLKFQLKNHIKIESPMHYLPTLKKNNNQNLYSILDLYPSISQPSINFIERIKDRINYSYADNIHHAKNNHQISPTRRNLGVYLNEYLNPIAVKHERQGIEELIRSSQIISIIEHEYTKNQRLLEDNIFSWPLILEHNESLKIIDFEYQKPDDSKEEHEVKLHLTLHFNLDHLGEFSIVVKMNLPNLEISTFSEDTNTKRQINESVQALTDKLTKIGCIVDKNIVNHGHVSKKQPIFKKIDDLR